MGVEGEDVGDGKETAAANLCVAEVVETVLVLRMVLVVERRWRYRWWLEGGRRKIHADEKRRLAVSFFDIVVVVFRLD